MATDSYEGQPWNEDEEQPRKPYDPMASLSSNAGDYPAVSPVAKAATMEPPPVESAPLGAAPSIAQNDKQPALPQRPQAPTKDELLAVEPHGWRKALGATFAGMGAFKSPELGQQIYDQEFEAPQRKLVQQRTGEQNAYDTELKQGQEKVAQERAAATIAVRGPNGETAYIPQKDYEKYLQNQNTVQGAQTRGEEKNTSAEKVAQGKEGSAEKIATGKEGSAEAIAEGKNKTAKEIEAERAQYLQNIARGHDLVSSENARLRAASADDPNKLTMMMKTQKQQAQATLPEIDKALNETERIAGKLGPTEGRWNAFWQGKVGADDPDYAHYKDQIGMVSTAVTLAHARGRMSNELFEHFQNMFDAGKQSPENMIQALNVAKEWLGTYATMGEPGSPVGGGPKPGEAQPKTQGPPREAKPGMKWQQNSRTKEYREVPAS